MPECDNCGAHVSAAYARVRAVDGHIHECPNCDGAHPDRHLRRAPPGTRV